MIYLCHLKLNKYQIINEPYNFVNQNETHNICDCYEQKNITLITTIDMNIRYWICIVEHSVV